MLSEDELKSIILAVIKGRPEGASDSAIEEGIQRALDWGSKVRTQSLLLDLIVSGSVVISVTPSGEIRFARPSEPVVTPTIDGNW
jgi:hypothetical protein